jgi:hypothetical protein
VAAVGDGAERVSAQAPARESATVAAIHIERWTPMLARTLDTRVFFFDAEHGR